MADLLIGTRQRVRISALAVAVLALLAVPGRAQAQLEVDQLEVFLQSVGNDRETSFRVRNSSNAPITARLTISDWRRGEAGGNHFTAPGTVPGACSDAVSVFPEVANIGAGEWQVVRVRYTGGARDAMCWSAVMVGLAARAAPTTPGAAIQVELRSAVKIYVAPTSERLDVALESIDAGPHVPRAGESAADTLGHDVIGVLTNRGNVHVRARVRVEYRTQADSIVARQTDNDVPMLPGATRHWRIRMPTLPAGRYAVLVVVDYGGPELVAGQLQLELTP